MAGTHEHTARARHDRENVAGLNNIRRFGVGRDSRPNGTSTIMGRDASRDTFGGFDGNGKRRAELRLVVACHLVEAELAAALFGQRQADQTTTKARHEVDRFRRDMVSG